MATPDPSGAVRGDRAGDQRSLRLSVADGVLHAVMLGACESYLGALAVELGHGDRNLALLATVPLLCGALAQLLSAPLTALARSRKRFVVAGASLQAVSVLALAYLAGAQVQALLPLLLIKTLFWSSGAAIVPAWGAWMALLTGKIDRERYFARRSGLVQVGLMLAFIAAGAVLHYSMDRSAKAFTYIFVAAAIARALSALMLALKDEPTRDDTQRQARTLASMLRQAVDQGQWRIPIYLAALMFGAHLSVPFFTPYMLRQDEGLGLNYAAYTGLLALSILAKAIVFPMCSRAAARFGLRALLIFGGVGLALIPLIWTFTTDLMVLVLAQFASGVVWAALEFSSFQLLLHGSPEACRGEYLSLAGSLAAGGQLCGALLASFLLASESLAYTDVFLFSAAMRAAALIVLLAGAWNLRLAPVRLISALASVRPTAGGVRRPLIFSTRSR